MEHRVHKRESIDLMAKLINRGSVVAVVRALDISPGGMRIETPGIKLRSGEGVTVDLYKPGYPRGVTCCLNAMVIHSGLETTGLMLSSQIHLHDIFHKSRAEPDVITRKSLHLP